MPTVELKWYKKSVTVQFIVVILYEIKNVDFQIVVVIKMKIKCPILYLLLV